MSAARPTLQCIHHHLDLDCAKLRGFYPDYYNGVADINFPILQYVQNQLARVATKPPPFTRSAPQLRSLHWLPVTFGIDFKLCLLTYNFGKNDSCSRDITHIPFIKITHGNYHSLVPRVKTNAGVKAFRSYASVPWNKPVSLSPLNCNLQEMSEKSHLSLGLSAVDTGMPDG